MKKRSEVSDEDLRRLLNDPLLREVVAGAGDEEAIAEGGTHPRAERLARYRLAPGGLSAEERRSVAAHLAACDACRGDIEGLAGFDFAAVQGPEAPSAASRLWTWIRTPPLPPRLVFTGAAAFALGALVVLLAGPMVPSPVDRRAGDAWREHETLSRARLALAEEKLALARDTVRLAREHDRLADEKLQLARRMRAEVARARVAPARAAPAPVPVASGGARDTARAGVAVAGEPVTLRMISDALAGNVMASGLPYDPNAFVAASTVYPMGTRVLIVNPYNGKSVKVTILDRPGTASDGIVISRAAYEALGYDADRPGNPRAEVGVTAGL